MGSLIFWNLEFVIMGQTKRYKHRKCPHSAAKDRAKYDRWYYIHVKKGGKK